MRAWMTKRLPALLLCLVFLAFPACRGNAEEPTPPADTQPTDGVVYNYSPGGALLSAITYEGGAQQSRMEYDYWPGGALKTISIVTGDASAESWNFAYWEDEVTPRRRVRDYTEDGFPCSDVYDYDEQGRLLTLATYEDSEYLGCIAYTYDESGEVSYSCQKDPGDNVINYTEYEIADGVTKAGYYYEYGSLSRYWVNEYTEKGEIAQVTFYRPDDSVLSRTAYEYNDADRLSRMLFYDAADVLLGYTESLYTDAGVHYKDIYYEDGKPVYGYNYTEEGVSTYIEY